MRKGYKPIFFTSSAVIISLLYMLVYPDHAKAKYNEHRHRYPMEKKTIVLDPGHGGYDKGAIGPDGTFEKAVTMELAQVLALELKKTYHVVLTRKDDYWVDTLTRTAMANHLNADMFISIHTGGSFLHQASGMLLYYFEKIPTSAFLLETESMEESKNSHYSELWYNIQSRHQKNSKVLAEGIQQRLKKGTGENYEYSADVQGAPLMVLEGADMPAILIEIGYITNPKEEKSLNDIHVLSDIAEKIKRGIDKFFEKNQN